MEKLRVNRYRDFLAGFKNEAPANYNFVNDFLDPQAASEPARLAMIHVDDAGMRHEYSFGFFAGESARLAGALAAKGVAKGDRVMLILYRRVEYWVAMLALARIGALPIPSPSLLTPHDIEFRVNFAHVSAVICEDSLSARVEAARAKCPDLRLLVQVGEAPLPPGWAGYEALKAAGADVFPRNHDSPGGDDPLVIFFSSGTTGMPKMVLHTHTYPLGHVATGAYWHDLEPGDVHLTLSDTGWAKSVWGKFYGQWLAGAVIFVWDFRGKFEPRELLRILSEHKVTTFCAPPTVYRFLVREDLREFDLSSLRHCTTAGELLNDSVFADWQKALGLPIFEGYGQTETTLQIATLLFMKPKPGSIGKPMPGWDIVLLNAEDQPCAPGEEGEICIRLKAEASTAGIPGLFSGYLDEQERTDKVVYGGFYHTGDKAWVDEDGYFWFLGRTDDLIKSSGYRIGPFEVESALVSHDAVIEAAVTGLPDPVRGMAVKATVVLAPGFEAGDALTKVLQDHVKSVTAPYKYPRIIEYVAELPKTISGKIKRAEIRARDLERMNM
ncbi:MAG: AMP-binding protein [Proteobacteria bacterium]|nr:AMP-binding protein [Pseudomonadota bacterium]MBU1595439.1 AMP-binding protein [Pseudomonadota bacterium]